MPRPHRRLQRPTCSPWRARSTVPDNAAASLLGGVTVSCQLDDGRIRLERGPGPRRFDSWWPRRTRARYRALAPPAASRGWVVRRGVQPSACVAAREGARHRPIRGFARGGATGGISRLAHRLCQASPKPSPSTILQPRVCLSGRSSIVALATDGAARAAALLNDVYRSVGVPLIRTLEGHQPYADAS
jgi:hypothetical protein